MKNKIVRMAFLFMLLFMVMLSAAACTKQDTIRNVPPQPVASTSEPATNEQIAKQHIMSFLTNGYSKYYRILGFESEVWKETAADGKYELLVLITMKNANSYKDPNTVPYIKEMREKALRETDPQKKLKLQKEYDDIVQQYNKPVDTNFVFKVTADMISDKIDEKTIQLLIEQDGPGGVIYVPAEEILPRK